MSLSLCQSSLPLLFLPVCNRIGHIVIDIYIGTYILLQLTGVITVRPLSKDKDLGLAFGREVNGNS